MSGGAMANLQSVPPTLQADELLVRGALRVEITLRPFAFTVRRSGWRLLRAAGLWVAEGRIADRFIHLTEGVVADEVRSPLERAVVAQVAEQGDGWVRLGLALQGGRRASVGIEQDGGIPQGDCAPLPWLNSSRGYAVWCETDANGTRFQMGGERIVVSTRSAAGPLRVHLLTAATPLARLRALCRLTGFPALLPGWAYGFWKSRDIHEHQADVHDDHDGFRRHDIALDAIVIDSPWATQYNTWEFNPHQFPDPPGLIRSLRADGVRTVVWVTPWVNLDSRDGQIPPQPESARLHAQPPPTTATARRGALRARARRRWMGTGSPIDFTSPAAEQWWREQVKGVLRLGVEGIKADDGDGFYITDHVRLADGRTGAEAAWALGGLHRLSLQRALDEVHPGSGVLFGRSGWTGQHATGLTWAGDQASDFWSLRVLVVAALSGAVSGVSNFSHDIGGLPRQAADRTLRPRTARALAAVRVLHPPDARPRAYAPGAVALPRACRRALPRLRPAARAARPLRARRRAHRRSDRGADHPAAVPDRLCGRSRLGDHRCLRLRAVPVGGAGA